MATSEIVFKSGVALAALIRDRKLSPVEVVRAFLDRIDAVNPHVNAFITVTENRALAEARMAEREIKAGRYLGPLHGLPYAAKDNVATRGVRTTNGAKVTADWIPDYESTITDRLNRAGAIMIGKLNLPEFTMGSGRRGLFGPTRNPWDLAYSPSGSSSGSGAAVASQMTPLAIGTDTGGSIRSPANSCGIVGLKPTYGRVSRFGITTLSWTCDHAGPMTKTVADAAIMLQAMAGLDSLDNSTSAEAVPDYREGLAGSLRGLRVGVPSNYFFDGVQAEALAAVRQALSVLRELGAVLVEVEVRHAELAEPALWIIQMSEGAAFHEERLKQHAEQLEPNVREHLEVATFYSAVDYIKSLRLRTVLMEEMRRVFKLCDVMAVPAGNPARRLDAEIVESSSAPASFGDSWSIGNMTGMPGIVLPCGFTAGPPALPLGLQLYARAFDEATLFRVGHAYESVTDWHKRRPPLPI
ncbi:MAG: amidase [Acidobacteriota bacterium]